MISLNKKCLIILAFVILAIGCFFLFKKQWPEEKFLGQDVQNLEKYLEAKGNSLSMAGNTRISLFRDICGLEVKGNQKLYYFYNKDKSINRLPLTSYGAYILVEDEKIIAIVRFTETDGL